MKYRRDIPKIHGGTSARAYVLPPVRFVEAEAPSELLFAHVRVQLSSQPHC